MSIRTILHDIRTRICETDMFFGEKACLNCFKHAQKNFLIDSQSERIWRVKGTQFPFPLLAQHQKLDHLRAAIHALGRDVLIRAVESEAAGAEVRRGQTHVGKAAAVRSAANRFDKRLHARLFAGTLCVFDQLHVVG